MQRLAMIGWVTLALATLTTGERASAQGKPDKAPAAKAPAASAKSKAIPTTPEEVKRAAQDTFGFVPQFILTAPDELLVGFWTSLTGLQMNPDTALDAKTKELVGLAVAAQIPCEYCVYFHTAAARKNGASDREIKEALGMAAVTRMASTLLNGSQLDRATFRKEADRVIGGETKPSQARSAPTRQR